MTVPPDSFLGLLDVHAHFLELFAQHQAALVEREYPRALERLLTLRREFEEHVKGEEALFVRLFARTDEVRGTPLELFLGEHKHLREWLTSFEDSTRRLAPGARNVTRDVIELLEEEALFKAFFRHHDERERNLLYPAFDDGIPDAERRAELERFHTRPPPG